MSLYEEKLISGALLPQALLKWDVQNDEHLKSVLATGQKYDVGDLLTGGGRDDGLAAIASDEWLEEQFDFSLFDPLPTEYDSLDDPEEPKDLGVPFASDEDVSSTTGNPTIDDQLSILSSIPVEDILPLLGPSNNDDELGRVTQELMDSISEQEFLSDTCSSTDLFDDTVFPLSPVDSITGSELEDSNSLISSLSPRSSYYELEVDPVITLSQSPVHVPMVVTPMSPYSTSSESVSDSSVFSMSPLSTGWCSPIPSGELISENNSLLDDPPSPGSLESDDSNDPDFSPGNQRSSKRISPYSRTSSRDIKVVMPKIKQQAAKAKASLTEKKERKKLQNKNAATKYRIKKKNQEDEINEEFMLLNEKNEKLNSKVDQLTREISYIKDLLAEVNKAKGKKF